MWVLSSELFRVLKKEFDLVYTDSIDLIGLAEQVYFHLMAPKTMDCCSRWRNVYVCLLRVFLKNYFYDY